MSYTFLLGPGEVSSAECFSDIPACALSNGIRTPANASSPANGTDACHASLSGTTCRPSTGNLGAGASMSCAGASRVRTSAQPERAQASTGSALECGTTWPESLAKYDRDTSLWRTRQCLLFEDSGECLETWPQWGMMLRGECWGLPTSAHRTSETVFGLWPTCVKMDGGMKPTRSRAEAIRRGEQPGHGGGCRNLRDYAAAGWTPKGISGEMTLARLNPEWCEWLMGWPTKWTELNAAATDKFRQWQHSHSSSFPLVLANHRA